MLCKHITKYSLINKIWEGRVIHGSSVLFNFIHVILLWYQSRNCFEVQIADGHTEGDLDTSFNPISLVVPLLDKK